MKTPEIIKKCTSCGKVQEWKKEWYFIVLTWNTCECWGTTELTFK